SVRVAPGSAPDVGERSGPVAQELEERSPGLALERRRLELGVVPVGDAVVARSRHAPMLASPYRGAASAAEITPVEPDPGHTGEGSALVPRCITIAGSDSGGGAGIQADLKAFAAAGCFGTSAIVALTAQNTLGVTAVQELPPGFILAELEAVFSDIGVDAAKTGMLFARKTLKT